MDTDLPPETTVRHNFDILFPLPYRICFEILMGVWGWGVNTQVLKSVHVDLGYMLRYQTGRTLHESVYMFASGLTLIYVVSILAYWLQLRGYDALGDVSVALQALDLLPWATFVVLIAIFLYPGPSFHHNGRRRLLSILKRVSLGCLDVENRLSDILVADGLTSYSKILVDIAIMTCTLLSGKSCLGLPNRLCGGELLVPLVSVIPFAIRLRQCLIDYQRTSQRIHVFNLLKYASSIPVILLSAVQRKFSDDDATYFGGQFIWNLWVIAIFINSTYSFVWDVFFDWDLNILGFKFAFDHGGLRSVLYFGSRYWYYLAIVIDYTLRFTWSLKLSSHWYHLADHESSLFTLELLEIFRRWVWMFFRLESEWVRNIKDSSKSSKALPLTELRGD